MTLIPRSLYGRLLALSALATLVALAFAAFAIGSILERFVIGGLDDRLDAQIAVLATAVRPDGTIDRQRAPVTFPYTDTNSGWGWRIDTPRDRLSSPTPPAVTDRSPLPAGPALVRVPGPPAQNDEHLRPAPFDWRDASGSVRHARRLLIDTKAGPATIVAAAPRAIVERPIRAAMAPLLGSLAVLGVALALASLVQLRLGLRPLGRLRRDITAIRSGAVERLPDEQPVELSSLVAELNSLLIQNAARLIQARRHAANLAHALKTPLATLALGLRAQGRDPDGSLGAEVARIDGAIRHHLGRARADAVGDSARPRVDVANCVEALAAVLARIHADRGIAFAFNIPKGLSLEIDPQDLNELLENLIDNGWRWARSGLSLLATREGRGVRVTISDDGPGISPEARGAAFARGHRLDEAGDGHGFGHSIAREIMELYGGTLDLSETPGGGLTVAAEFPDQEGGRGS